MGCEPVIWVDVARRRAMSVSGQLSSDVSRGLRWTWDQGKWSI